MPYTYEDARRVHDTAFMEWLGTFHCDYNSIAGVARNDVPCLAVLASPDRAFAAVTDLLVRLGWIAGTGADQMRRNADAFEVLPMPICVVQRIGEPTPDPELTRPPGLLTRLELDEMTQQWVPHPFPRFYYTQYSVQFWSKRQSTGNLFAAWLYSNLGKQGSAHNEAMIPVKHAMPWGEMLQRLRFDGAVDTSALEGEEPRYIRTDYTFSLRTLILHVPAAKTEFIDKLHSDLELPARGFGNTSERTIDISAAPPQLSHNLWAPRIPNDYISLLWPKTGAAVVGPSTLYPGGTWPQASTGGLRMCVSVEADAVVLYERLARLDGDGELVNSLAFRYISDQSVVLELRQRAADNPEESSILQQILPASAEWKRVQIYALATSPIWSARIRGIDAISPPARSIQLVDIDARHITTAEATGPEAQAGIDPVIYEWAGLAPGVAYLLKARITGGAATVTLLNDSVHPTDTVVVNADTESMQGLVLFVAPVASSVRLLAPAGVSLAALSLSRYAGPHNGNEV